MTNEEAMEIMYRVKQGLMPEGTPEAAEMAIKALEYEKEERYCQNCKHHTDGGCSSWDCQFEPKEGEAE